MADSHHFQCRSMQGNDWGESIELSSHAFYILGSGAQKVPLHNNQNMMCIHTRFQFSNHKSTIRTLPIAPPSPILSGACSAKANGKWLYTVYYSTMKGCVSAGLQQPMSRPKGPSGLLNLVAGNEDTQVLLLYF